MKTLVWFRQDLRVADNPALAYAASKGEVVPVYVVDDETPGEWRMGGASRWWLGRSLEKLKEQLGGLVVRRGDAREVIPALVAETGAEGVVWNRCYEPYAVRRDTELKELLGEMGVAVQSFKGNVLFEPWEVKNGSGGDFKVFTPYWKACTARLDEVGAPLPAPKVKLAGGVMGKIAGDSSCAVFSPKWSAGWESLWTPGEAGAMVRLDAFVKDGLDGYAEGRDRPDLRHFSRLSAHLHFGEISARQVWGQVKRIKSADVVKFMSEIGWREFATQVLYHSPTLPDGNWKREFDAYPWREAPEDLERWQRGMTGYPLVDAGMRELWQTGFMHNRVRMVVASFLIKHLRIHWVEGERWFWDTLVDADLANNAMGWQWVAGSGADAAPYFRIFNPFGQGQKFDPAGAYVRRWVPELSKLSTEHIHTPWLAPEGVLRMAGVRLGETYPRPMVEHDKARAAAMAGYAAVKGAKAEPNEKP